MRKSLLLAATAAASAMLVLGPTASAFAATHDVLTTGKVGGPNVKVGAVLQAGLKARTVASFSSPGTTITAKCTRSTITSKVTANPARPGKAVLSLTAQTFGGCTITIGGVKVLSLTVKHPDRTTISDAKGNPVTVFGPSATIKLMFGTATFSCTYTAKQISGHASNVGSLISFSKQILSRSAGPANFCPAKGALSATYGPVVDMSVKGHPHVFVN